ncbi:unnamed protein product, partial [Ectocarpus fasciculatus]
ELASDNPQNKKLYLALAVLPRGLAFPAEVAGALLYGSDCSEQDVEVAGKALETLERWSILTVVWARVGGEDVPSRPYEAVLEAMDPSSSELPTTLVSAAGFHEQREEWREAHRLFSQELALQTKAVGIDHSDVATTLIQLGVCAFKARKTAEAEGSPAIREKAMVVDQPNAATILHSLGVRADETGGTDEAGVYNGPALTMPEATSGVNRDG